MKVEFRPLQIVGLKSDLDRAVSAIYDLGYLDIVPADDVPGFEVAKLEFDEEQRERLDSVGRALAQVETLMETLSLSLDRGPKPNVELDPVLDRAVEGMEELRPRVEELVERRRRLEEELESLPRYRETLRKLQPYVPASAHDPKTTLFGVMVHRRHRPALAELRRELTERMPGKLDYGSGTIDDETMAMLIVAPDEVSGEVDQLLGTRDVSRLRMPEGIPRDSLEAMLGSLEDRMEMLPVEIDELDAGMAELADEWGEELECWRAGLVRAKEKLEVMKRFGETEQTFVVIGWCPQEKTDQVESALEGALAGRVHVGALPQTEELEEQAPVQLQNLPLASPFERLVELLGLPSRGSLDPSPLMAVFMPMFFGMMLGDLGYGALVLLISLLLTRRFEGGVAKDLLRILALGAAWAMVFGVLFGEAFGTLGHELGMHAIWFDRASPEYVPTLLAVTVGVGAAHVALGLAIGVWEAVQERSRSHMLQRGGMLLALVALLLLAGALAEFLPAALMTPSVAAMIVGVVLLGASRGKIGWIVGPIEFVGLIGDVLSYLRIAAIGLASVYLATVANEIAGLVGSLVVGVIIAVLLHTLNVVMGSFSPSIHSLRLHYVEFFQKFYTAGGRGYQPFGGDAEVGP